MEDVCLWDVGLEGHLCFFVGCEIEGVLIAEREKEVCVRLEKGWRVDCGNVCARSALR